MRKRTISRWLFLLGLLFALLGQFYLTYRREFMRDGLLFWGLALVALVVLLLRSERVGRSFTGLRRLVVRARRYPLRAVAIAGGIGCSLLAGFLARGRPATAGFGDLCLLWGVGVFWFLAAFAPPVPARELYERARSWWRAHWREVGLLALLVLSAWAARGLYLERIPANLGGDEGTQGLAALELVRPPFGNPFSTGWFSVPTMSFAVAGVAMRLFGATVAGLRALSAVAGALTVLTTYLFARELWDRRVAWFAALLLTPAHFHLHFSRLGSNQIGDGLLITLALWLFAVGLRTRRAWPFALSGAVVGLGWYAYFGARLIGIVVAAYVAWEVLRRPDFLTRYGRHLLVLGVAALVVLAPLLFHYAAYPDTLAARADQVNIFSSGWLSNEQVITGRSAVSLLLQQFWKSISAFNYTLDPTFWYHPSIPLLDWVSGAFFVLGLLWSMAHWGRRGQAALGNRLLLLWFWLALLLGWVMTENPPSSMRLVIIAPSLAVLAALGLDWVLRLSRRLFNRSAPVRLSGITLVVLLVGFLNLYYYFVVYTPQRIYGNPTAEVGTDLAHYLVERGDDRPVYFYGAPVMYWNFGVIQFIARDVEGYDVPPLEEQAAPVPAIDGGATFVFLPSRLDELLAVRERYPGGVKVSLRSSVDGRVLCTIYELFPP